jgi:hypothetical protein
MARTTTATINSNVLYGAGTSYTTGTNWVAPNNYESVMTVNNTGEKDPALNVTGKFFVNGIDLEERLEIIEKVLHIPQRDSKLEAEYPRLKKLFNEYISALEQYRTWDKLKGEGNAT